MVKAATAAGAALVAGTALVAISAPPLDGAAEDSLAVPLRGAIALSGSPSGKRQSQIYLLSLTNGRITPITRGPGSHRAFGWTADGSRLLVAQRGGLYAIRTNGSSAVRLTSSRDGFNAGWSPSGRRLAFRGPGGGLYVVNAKGGRKHRLARGVVDGGVFSGNLSWSPNGSQIVFARRDGIYVVASDGSAPARLIKIRPRPRTHCCEGPSIFVQPRWSPRGSRIAFVVDEARTAGYAIYVMKPDGSQAARLHPGHGPVWSPDGSAIAYRHKGNQVMRADGTHVRQWRACWCGISFSPDASRLAYAGGKDRKSSGALFLMNSDGSGKSRILYAPGGVFRLPLWRRGTATTEGG